MLEKLTWAFVALGFSGIALLIVVDGWFDYNECVKRHQLQEPGRYRCF